ncbi:hypothetical protein A9G11_05010 [Gilliamella sp. wkB108]|uniref:hypothetical protein n=1 Tax=Gilliamella sp. wkB108 TaxID=3120256 RepID=UPI00080E6F96|nr:hypothetical protein [Gilliamella apicola]OCG23983.1 hypothetical protein A9G11_05010 [Gilliamella apicola]
MNNKQITVDCHIDRQYLIDSYYARWGSLDDDFTQKLDDSIANNMRNFTFIFDDEKMVKLNKDKDEISTFYYSQLFQIQETKNGFIFFSNNMRFDFLSYDLFKPADLVAVKKYLASYLGKNQEPKIATIEDYVIDYNRIYTLFRYLLRNITKCYLILSINFLFLGILFVTSSLSSAALLFFLSFFSFVIFINNAKNGAKDCVSSLNERFRNMTCIFYDDRLEFIFKQKISVSYIKYDEFYKIEKAPKGYSFSVQKYSGYFFFYEEFTAEQRQALEEKLKQYKNYYQK